MVPPSTHDRYGIVAELRDALARPELAELHMGTVPSENARLAARALAVALGNCRLFNVDANDARGVLPPEAALAAASELTMQLRAEREAAERLPFDWDAAEDQLEMDDLCATLLEDRMEAWAALLSIEEASEAARARSSAHADELEDALHAMMEALANFDEALENQVVVLSTICELPLLDNWRTMLASSPHVEYCWPWWLDGTLETTAAKIKREASRPPEIFRWGTDRPLEADRVGVARFSKEVAVRNAEPSYSVGADPEKSVSAFQPLCLVWESPDRRFSAQLMIPSSARRAPESRLTLQLCRTQPLGEPATGHFTSVTLQGLPSRVVEEPEAVVTWTSDAFFSQAAEDLRLFVDGDEWIAVEVIGGAP